LGIPPKKKRTPFYWVSKLRRAIRKWIQPLDLGYTSKKKKNTICGLKNEEHHENVARFWVYLQKKKNTILLGLKIKKNNKKMAKTIGFWVYLQKKKNSYFWVTGRRKRQNTRKLETP
jgi:hypothetical protein